MDDENHERRLGKRGKKGNTPVVGVAGMEGAPDLLDSFNFFSLSAYVVRTAEKFCRNRENL